jgi:hypothetical protein
MSKGKGPRKRKDPIEIERQTQEKAELVPPARRPPTAVGAETPPLPPPEPPRPGLPRRQSSPIPERARPAFSELVQALRLAVGAVLDLADAAVEAIRNRIEGQA